MRQVLSSEFGLADPCVELCVDFVECALERGIDGAQSGKCGGEPWAQEAVVNTGEEQSRAQAEAGDAIAQADAGAADGADR